MLCFILFIFMHMELGVCISIIGMANMANVGGLVHLRLRWIWVGLMAM